MEHHLALLHQRHLLLVSEGYEHLREQLLHPQNAVGGNLRSL